MTRIHRSFILIVLCSVVIVVLDSTKIITSSTTAIAAAPAGKRSRFQVKRIQQAIREGKL